jgi:hypothetical protein
MFRPELDDGCKTCRTCAACRQTPPIHRCCFSVQCMETGTYHACACDHMGGAA